MTNRDSIIQKIVAREEQSGCYDIYIEGYPAYSMIRYYVRLIAEQHAGIDTITIKGKNNLFRVISSCFLSLYQILQLFLSKSCYENVFNSFPRVDKVGELYLDKFTDPIIDLCEMKNYIILDHGRGGYHMHPRLHQNNIIYTDLIHVFSALYAKFFYNSFSKRNASKIQALIKAIDYIVIAPWNKKRIICLLIESIVYSKIHTYLFKKIKAKKVAGPSRFLQVPVFVAAKNVGMKTYEFQHGVTCSESEMYSGRRVKEIEPDIFFAFGDNKPNDVYGISPLKIVNIGWPFQDYLNKNANSTKNRERDVLVISDPEVSETMVKVVDKLARAFADSIFYFRPHPQEVLSLQQLQVLTSHSNVRIHDTNINLMEALYGFYHVIGESSTALYEAISLGKKVGRLFMMDLHPQYLEPEDRDCSWEIYDEQDFLRFLNEDISTKKSKNIYSPFDKEKFLNSFK